MASSKDEIMIIDVNEHRKPLKPSTRELLETIPKEIESVFPDGRINVDCPCLHSALAHKCGYLLRDALGCFNSSTKTPRGIDCESEFLHHAICVEDPLAT